jgi:hypothetical protein
MQAVVAKDKERQVEQALSQSGFGMFQIKILLLRGFAQLGAYAAYTSGLVGGQKIAAGL